MNVLIFGPPGAGKGTQSGYLVSRNGMYHISTGDLFRSAIKAGSPLGREVKSILDAGKLVPDDLTIAIVKEKLAGLEGKEFILDGFPRTVNQAHALDELLKNLSLELGKVIFLQVDEGNLISRLSGRRVCRSCGATYHTEYNKPKVNGVCDQCGKSDLYQRPDDSEDAIATRLKVYKDSTRPLRDYYQAQGRMVEVSGSGEVDDVYERIQTILKG
jgi:adenylate kinase